MFGNGLDILDAPVLYLKNQESSLGMKNDKIRILSGGTNRDIVPA